MSDIPLQITIPTPTPAPRARGIHSSGRFGDVLRFRCSLQDKEAITKAASLLGLTDSEFMRACAVSIAARILEEAGDGLRTD